MGLNKRVSMFRYAKIEIANRARYRFDTFFVHLVNFKHDVLFCLNCRLEGLTLFESVGKQVTSKVCGGLTVTR